MRHDSNQSTAKVTKRFGSEIEVAALTGISRRTLQNDRLLKNRKRFPWYKSGRRVLYDLDEVEAIIRRAVQGGAFVRTIAAEACQTGGEAA